MNIAELLGILDTIAPFASAEAWDNVGLLAGSEQNEVGGILCALELDEDVLARALALGCDTMVVHHPIMFKGRKDLRSDDAEGRLLRRLARTDLSLVAMHTNFDRARPVVNDALAERLGLTEVRHFESGMRLGDTEESTLKDFSALVGNALGEPVRCYGDPAKIIRSVAVMGGSGGDCIPDALSVRADAFVTGEVGYHRALEASWNGLAVLEAGHAATERPAAALLARLIREKTDNIGLTIPVYNLS